MFKNVDAFTGFSVDNIKIAKNFYGEILGLNLVNNPMGMIDIHLAGGGKILIYPKEDHKPATYTVLNFLVDNIDNAVDELVKKGVAFEQYDDIVKTDKKGIARGKKNGKGPNIAWFKDPAGNFLAVIEK